MKRESKIQSIQVDCEEFHALSVGRQRYVILRGDSAKWREPGDFIELIEKLDKGTKEVEAREPERYVVQITHVVDHVRGVDPDCRICSVARVTEVALRLREAKKI